MTHAALTRRDFVRAGAGALVAAAVPTAAEAHQHIDAPAGSTLGRTPPAELIRIIPRLLELAAVPGTAVSIVDADGVWSAGFGQADVEKRAGVTADTVFEAASLGKPIFAYAVLRLAERGKLELDRPLYDYLPIADGNNPRFRRITARHVLSHTTGLPNWRLKAAPLEPDAEPGAVFRYSGEAFFYLQRVMERLTDQPFGRHMDREVFEPFGMKSSSFTWLPEFETRMAGGYDHDRKRLDVQAPIGRLAASLAAIWKKPLSEWRYADSERAVPQMFPKWDVLPAYMVPNAAGSLLTTASDYARFLSRVVAQPGTPGLDLRDTTRRSMLTPQIRLNRALSWGLGWALQEDEHGTVLWHWGANTTFRNFALADPAKGRAVVVFTNGENGPKVYQRIVTNITGHDEPAFLWAAI
jgi:CubicO group peptidase (beta-lactamase class C family)